MDYSLLFEIADRSRGRERLAPADAEFIRDVVPRELASFPHIPLPKKVRHPAGFSLSGAPVHTFTWSALILSASRVLGPRYAGGSAFYDHVERDFAMRIMRSNFHRGFPRGVHCCAQCTLAVYPVLQAGAIRWFESKELAKDVRKIIESRQWLFKNFKHARMLEWALG